MRYGLRCIEAATCEYDWEYICECTCTCICDSTCHAGETIETMLPVTDFSEDVFLVLLTRSGWIKKTPLNAFQKISARGLIAVSLADGDVVVRAALCSADDSVMLSSRRGQEPL